MSAHESDLSALVARFVAQAPSMESHSLDRAKKVFVDTVSANIAGASSDVLPVLERYLATLGGGTHPVLGTRLQTTAEGAALTNATLSAALEFDDVLSMMPGHPSAVVLAALCVSEAALQASGREVLEAYAVGVEAGARVAQALTLDHYKRGFHATGTVALFSALAALARIEKLSVEQTQQAIGIAASFSSGLHGNFGTMTKPLHSGWAARNAVAAIALARSGLTASPRIFETEGGYFDAYGSSNSSAALVASKFASPWVFDEPGVTLKLFPCCYATHRGIDALLEIQAELQLKADQVDQLICRVPTGGLIPLKFAHPVNHFQSLFSMPYALAVTLLDGHPSLGSFKDERVRQADIARMLERIDVAESPECVEAYPDFASKSYGSRGEVRVTVHTRGGRQASRAVHIAPGHPDRPPTWEQSHAKFRDCAQAAGFTADQASALFPRLAAFELEPHFGRLLSQLALS